MTFQEIQNDVVARLGSANGIEFNRIGRAINTRYKELVSSIGLQTSVRSIVTASTVVGNRLLVFTAEKLFSVYDNTVTPPNVLNEVTLDEIRNWPGDLSGTPSNYAIYQMGASTVTIYLDATPTAIQVLTADAEANVSTLAGTSVPNFPEDYHDILIYGAMATELDNRAQYDLAQKQEVLFQRRAGDLRMFIAKSQYLTIYQGKTSGFGYPMWWPTV